MNLENKTFFLPGDICKLNKDIPNVPIMYVVRKETKSFRPDIGGLKDDFLLGIRCRWFTSTGELQEAIFNTKDITHC